MSSLIDAKVGDEVVIRGAGSRYSVTVCIVNRTTATRVHAGGKVWTRRGREVGRHDIWNGEWAELLTEKERAAIEEGVRESKMRDRCRDAKFALRDLNVTAANIDAAEALLASQITPETTTP